MDYLAITGLRSDGRLPTEHRRVNVELGVHASGDGSALFELGQTKVWASCRGPRESSTIFGVYVEVAAAAFGSNDRRRMNKSDRKARDLAQTLERAFSQIVQTKTFQRSRVDLQIRVIQNDGGLAWAAFNACSLALMDAGVPMRDLCVACGVAYSDRAILVDPSMSENTGGRSSLAGGELWMALAPREAKVVSCTFGGKVSGPTMEALLDAAEDGSRQLHAIIEPYVTTYYKTLHLEEEDRMSDASDEYMDVLPSTRDENED